MSAELAYIDGTGRFRTAGEFVAGLRRLKDRAEVGYRMLEKRATAAGDVLPRSTMTAALRRDALPREDLVVAFTRACGCGPAEVARWVAARRRLARGAPYEEPASAGLARWVPPALAEAPRAAALGLLILAVLAWGWRARSR